MLVIKVEVWPGGTPELAREVGRAGLGNVSALAATSDYVVVRLDDTGRVDHGVIRGHVRAEGFWPLVGRAAAAELDRSASDTEAAIATRLGERLFQK